MMDRLSAGVKEALFVLGVLTVALTVTVVVLAVWLSGENGGTEAAPAPPPAAEPAEPPPPPAPEPTPPPPPPAEPPPAPEPPPAEPPPAPEPPPAEPPAAPGGDPAAGEEVFASAGCGSCHTLAAAGASGTIGPSLDDAKPPFELVVETVTNGRGVMPAFGESLSEQQIQDVAAYVVQATSG